MGYQEKAITWEKRPTLPSNKFCHKSDLSMMKEAVSIPFPVTA
jgi:hypothetical protein